VVVGLPALIIAVAAGAFPEYRVMLVVALVVLLAGAVILWLGLRNRELETDVQDLRVKASSTTPPVSDGRMWQDLETVELLLEGWWKSASARHFPADSTIRVTASGDKRFIVHLATDIVESTSPRKRKFRAIESSAEGKNLRRTFDIKAEGDYAIVVEPLGNASFWVKVTTELEYVSRGIRADW
jgi:hypothetical protein